MEAQASDISIKAYLPRCTHRYVTPTKIYELSILIVNKKNYIGENLARFFLEVTDDYGITPQIHCITADNAANNGALGKELEKLANMRNDFKFSRSENMLGCMNHIVNLACQELIVKGLKSIAPPDVSDLHAMMKEVNLLVLALNLTMEAIDLMCILGECNRK